MLKNTLIKFLRIFWLFLAFLGVRGYFSLRNSKFILGILEFLEIASVALLPRNDAGNSRIPKLEFPKLCVIPRLDPWILSQINLEFLI